MTKPTEPEPINTTGEDLEKWGKKILEKIESIAIQAPPAPAPEPTPAPEPQKIPAPPPAPEPEPEPEPEP